MNVRGPENTSLYTKAESNTASDITDDINNTKIDEKTGKVIGGKIIKDMMRYAYNSIITTTNTAAGKISKRIGSIIIKNALNKDFDL